MKKNVLIITNAGENIGGGHLSRCLALAQALDPCGARISWALNRGAERMANDIAAEDAVFFADPFDRGRDVLFASLAEAGSRADIVVVDTYAADASFYERLTRCTNSALLVVSDAPNGPAEPYASFVVDYAPNAGQKGYAISQSSARFLLGPRYSLLRRAFWNIETSSGGYALLIPGAADVTGASLWYAQRWREDMLPLKIVCGPLVSADAVAETRSSAGPNVEVLHAPDDLPAIIAGADFLFCTASVTMIEALALDKNTAVFSAASNQNGVGEYLEDLGALRCLGPWGSFSFDDVERALSFKADARALRCAADRRGAVNCAKEVLAALEH